MQFRFLTGDPMLLIVLRTEVNPEELSKEFVMEDYFAYFILEWKGYKV